MTLTFRQTLALVVPWSAIVCVLFLAAKGAAGGAGWDPAQTDSTLYHQYARAFADGYPYRYTADQPPSTGSTSHLYPLVLAVFYKLGARGAAPFIGSLVLGAAGYAATLLLVLAVTRKLRPDASITALLLAGLSGPLAFVALSDTDMSLFVPLALGAWAAALYGRYVALALLLVVCVAARPEGALLSIGLVLVAGTALALRAGDRRALRAALAAGLAGSCAVVLVGVLNHAITGQWGFQSLNGKNYFAQFPLCGAALQTVRDLAGIWRELFWGVTTGPRELFVLPLVGGMLFTLGGLTRPWDTSARSLGELWMLIALGGASVLLAASGWSGVAFDRYLGWMLPAFYIYIAIGAHALAERMGIRAFGLNAVLVAFQAAGLVFFASQYGVAAAHTAAFAQFSREADAALPPGRKLGGSTATAAAYFMNGRSFVNIYGIVSPEFLYGRSVLEYVELLKHEPNLRFDYWMVDGEQAARASLSPLLGAVVLRETDPLTEANAAFTIYKADWSALDAVRVRAPATPAAKEATKGMALADAIDIGYRRDEESHARRVFTRLPGVRLLPFAMPGTVESVSGPVLETGDAVIGAESFTIHSKPATALRVVLRTARQAEVEVRGADGSTSSHTFDMASTMILRVVSDGALVGDFKLALGPDAGAYQEVTFDLPASAFRSDTTRLTIGGDHIACAYWFYQ